MVMQLGLKGKVSCMTLGLSSGPAKTKAVSREISGLGDASESVGWCSVRARGGKGAWRSEGRLEWGQC